MARTRSRTGDRASVFFDQDSTVIKKETLDELIARALAGQPNRERMVAEVKEITRLGMEGKLPFKESVKRRLAVVPIHRNLVEEISYEMVDEITSGMHAVFHWLKDHGHTVYIVTGGFEEYVGPVARALQIPDDRCLANRFVFDDAGYVVGVDEKSLLWTNDGKAPALRDVRRQLGPKETFVMVGDGANDLRAYELGAADMFVGFGANVRRESVVAKAPHFVNSSHQLLSFFEDHL